MPFPRLVRPPETEPDEDALIERSDDELMALARAGLRRAFAVLVARYAERVVRLCARFVGDPELASELAQDTWVLVWQGREKYRAEGSFVAWLVTVARNHCRNELRRRRSSVKVEQPELAEPQGDSPGVLDEMLVEERRRRVRSALEQLSAPLREALFLRFGEELRYDEMTTVLGAGESTLRSRVHHGLRALKTKLEDES